MKNSKLFILFLLIITLISCGDNKKQVTQGENESNVYVSSDKQLNLTFLLDLSDRIEPSKYPSTPSHYEKDIAVIQEFVEVFKNEMFNKKNKNMKGKMRIIFSPAPANVEINDIAKKLDINTSTMKPAEKTNLYRDIEANFTNNLKIIYEKTLESKNYIGSDVWRFFKNDVKDLAIDRDPAYRNILVILTDGYLYHQDTKMQEKNRYSYILPVTAKSLGLANADWKDKMESIDFGLIPATTDLDNLEVLILEVNPSKNASPYEEDIQKEVLSKWLTEMGVKKFNIYKTDLPQTTKTRIENFINQ